MKKTFAFLWGVLASVAVEAQEKFHFSVDRPGIADLPTVIPSRSLQLETGVEFYRREQGDNIYLPTALIRYGIIKPLELRVSTRLQRFTVRNESGQTTSLGLNPLTVGLKTNLLKERGWFPATSLVTDLTIPQTGVRKFREQRVGSSALVLFENNIHDQILINYNIGVQWSGAPGELTTMYAVCLEYEINGTNAALFVEQSTFFHNQTKDDYWIDAGYTHLITPASQVDISSGIDLNGGPLDFFVAVGYSLRLGFIE